MDTEQIQNIQIHMGKRRLNLARCPSAPVWICMYWGPDEN